MTEQKPEGLVAAGAVFAVAITTAAFLAIQGPGVMRDAAWVLWFVYLLVAVFWLVKCVRLSPVVAQPVCDGGPPDHTRIAHRTARDGDQMTDEERAYIGRTTLAEGHPRCPDCGTALCAGPCGGSCVNYACPGCGSRFNCMIFTPNPASMTVHAERISDAGIRLSNPKESPA